MYFIFGFGSGQMATMEQLVATLADIKVAVGQVSTTVAALKAEVADLKTKTVDQDSVDAARDPGGRRHREDAR
jgi:cell division protein FtsB